MRDRRPYPQVIEAERAILGGLLQWPKWLNTISENLLPEDFQRPEHQALYALLVERWRTDLPIDLITIPNAIAVGGHAHRFGGIAYVVELPDHVPSTANLGYYGELIAHHASLRRFLSQMEGWADRAYKVEDPAVLFDEVVDTLRAFRRPGGRHQAQWFGEMLGSHLDRAEELFDKGQPQAISTGYSDLDYRLGGGLYEDDLIILAARPGMGKSALAMNILLRAGIDLGKQKRGAVGLFSLEMGKAQIMDRWLATTTGQNMRLIRQPYKWGTETWEEALKVQDQHRDLPIIVDTRPALSLEQIRSTALRWKTEHDIRLIVVDYLQLMQTPFGKRQEGVGRNSAGLKQLAKDLGIPVIALAQLNRKLEERKDRRPIPSDLRDSGEIEQDADVIIFLYRDYVYNRKIPKDMRRCTEIIVPKQRQGEPGTERLEWWGETQLFTRWPSVEERRKRKDQEQGLTPGPGSLDNANQESNDGTKSDGVEGKQRGGRRDQSGGSQGGRGTTGQTELGLDPGGGPPG